MFGWARYTNTSWERTGLKNILLGACWESPHLQVLSLAVDSLTGNERAKEGFCSVTCSVRQSLYRSLPKPMFWGQFSHQSRGDICRRLESLLIGSTEVEEVSTDTDWVEPRDATKLPTIPPVTNIIGTQMSTVLRFRKPSLNQMNSSLISMNLFIKQKETYRLRKQTHGYQREKMHVGVKLRVCD